MPDDYSSDSYLTSEEKLALARKIRQQHQRALGNPVEDDPVELPTPSPEERSEQAWRESKQQQLLDRELDPNNFFLLSRG